MKKNAPYRERTIEEKIFRAIYLFFRFLLIVLFFPISLLILAYLRQRKSKKEYYDRPED